MTFSNTLQDNRQACVRSALPLLALAGHLCADAVRRQVDPAAPPEPDRWHPGDPSRRARIAPVPLANWQRHGNFTAGSGSIVARVRHCSGAASPGRRRDGELAGHGRARSRRAVHGEGPAERLDPVPEPDQAGCEYLQRIRPTHQFQ
jgi:hypothetical protein